MNTSQIMLILGLVYFVAHGFNFLFVKFKIPDVLLFMIIGLILGPLSGFVDLTTFGRVGDTLSTLALVLILYRGGVSLDVRSFRSVWISTSFLTLSTAALTIGIFYFVGRSLGLESGSALILGAILCGTSSAVVIPMAKALNLESNASTMATIESALTDVLCIVLTTSLILAQKNGSLMIGSVLQGIGLSMLGAVLVGIVLGIAWNFIARLIRTFPNTNFATLAFGLLVYGVSELLGVSGGISVMAYGFTLANSSWIFKQPSSISETENKFYDELVFVLKTFFFVYMGISILFKEANVIVGAFIGVIACFVVRALIARVALPKTMDLKNRSYLALLIPKGLAAAVLAGMPLQFGISGAEIIKLSTYSVVLFSVLVCALIVPFVEHPKVFPLLGRLLGQDAKS